MMLKYSYLCIKMGFTVKWYLDAFVFYACKILFLYINQSQGDSYDINGIAGTEDGYY